MKFATAMSSSSSMIKKKTPTCSFCGKAADKLVKIGLRRYCCPKCCEAEKKKAEPKVCRFC